MDQTAKSSLRGQLLELVARSRADLDTWIAGLSPAEREATGTFERWAAKDHIAHVAAWKRYMAGVLVGAAAGQGPAAAPAEADYNAQVFAAQQHRPWAAVLADAAQAHAALVAGLEGLSDADLGATDRFPWRNGRPLADGVLGNSYSHVVEHMEIFARQRGDLAGAEAWQRRGVETVRAIFGAGEAYSYAVYNLGCFYAQAGRLSEALAAVREALALTPSLTAWAREDADLDPLHADPAFTALTAEG